MTIGVGLVEPLRLSRRLQSLRVWGDEYNEKISSRSLGASRLHGAGSPSWACRAMGLYWLDSHDNQLLSLDSYAIPSQPSGRINQFSELFRFLPGGHL